MYVVCSNRHWYSILQTWWSHFYGEPGEAKSKDLAKQCYTYVSVGELIWSEVTSSAIRVWSERSERSERSETLFRNNLELYTIYDNIIN